MIKTVKTYDEFNFRRYGNPWVAEVIDMKISFANSVGGYTGGYNKGEAGELYVKDPIEGKVYAYGQKDYRGNSQNSITRYVVFQNCEFVEIEKTELSKYF